MREEIARKTKRLEESAKEEDALKEEFEEQQKEVEALESELEAIIQRSKEFEAELKRRAGEERLQLQEDQIEEFNAKYILPSVFSPLAHAVLIPGLSFLTIRKEEAGLQTTKLKQEVEQITRQQKLDLERRDALEAKLNELKARKAYDCPFRFI